MDISTLRHYLDDPYAAGVWLCRLGLVDVRRAHGNLLGMAEAGVPLDLLIVLCEQLEKHLPGCADPDMALHNLERFVRASRNPLSVGTLFERDPHALPTLLQIFSTSQYLSDLLAVDPESFDLLRLTEGQPVARRALVEELSAEIAALEHETAVLRALRRFKRRETLRIAYADIVREQSLKIVTEQISYVADAIVEAALRAAWRKVQSQRGSPRRPDGQPSRFAVLGMGKLGGLELNYSSDIDLIFLAETEGRTEGGRTISNAEFFDLVAREIVRLLTEKTELGSTYRVDLRLRPEGQRGPMVADVQSALNYYDNRGRTWERQAYIKARTIAGDPSLGGEFLETLRPWIYRRYLSHADISGIKALKRRIEQLTDDVGGGARDVKTGRGGIRDVEFVIQFLQLLNGGDLSELRTGNTLEALRQLEHVGCLTNLEWSILEQNYSFLRKIEHRLQIMLDLQTHLLPEDRDELRKLALRMGYATTEDHSALEAFLDDYRAKTELNRKILDHLLHDAFHDDQQSQAEVDLVLDPDPPEARIVEVLGKYPFRDVRQAYRNLMSLAEERIRFLSTRRCRHFLAAIAQPLLSAIAATADADSTLVNLDKVSDSLGGKGVLWELFSFNPPSLRLYVELCAYSPHLSGILTSNPGMIDSLMDSLVLDKLPTLGQMQQRLAELCRGAEDIDPILHSFKNDQQLCVGVRDILGKEDVQATTGALSDIAEACLGQIAESEYEKLASRFGRPCVEEGRRAGRPCPMVVLALGKFGGREMNYHSDLDVIFLYEADGHTAPTSDGIVRSTTTNQHFFSELGQRIIKTTGRMSGFGRLYEIDARLRPTGRSGALATTFDEFARYFAEGGGQLWERQALCKARAVYGSPSAVKGAMSVVAKAAFSHRWRHKDAVEIRRMRRRLEETAASEGDLKRGPGGLVDVEFLVQMLQLKHARGNPELRSPNTLDALAALERAGLLNTDDYRQLDANYRLLRTIEGRLRLMNSTARDQLPRDAVELTKLANLLHYPSREELLTDYETATRRIRATFDRIFDES
ncbi:MAG: bifunctional [glutamate--ammonia ligase]-adenylyl-L-tyrosine phosphorylase/[glutamate--ammonia-ligase] adenylyltransferase [Planctomycetaceae bacterium]|nr:bifunctional [glutamate--ammonia ligase]-adenylyl-L-tyrosine phosphorylase/[glutamate--ammonia-ligase] adenylyltransferase [Planctomycetaceae bacterium]